jgi:hypothetical protein
MNNLLSSIPGGVERLCLTLSEARCRLGIGREAFELHWRPALTIIPAGTRKLVLVHDLEALLQSKKAEASRSCSRPIRSEESISLFDAVVRRCRRPRRG